MRRLAAALIALTVAFPVSAARADSFTVTPPGTTALYSYDVVSNSSGSASVAGFVCRVTSASAGTPVTPSAGDLSSLQAVIAVAAETAAGDLAGAACGGESFTPDTNVVMADGTTKPLDEVKVGDKVEATNPKSGKTTAQTVTAVWVNHDTDLMDVSVTVGGKTSTIQATQHHLFWDATRHSWVEADQLVSGDALRTDDGTIATVAATVIVPGVGDMWDLTVADDHDFYVVTTTANILVHNCPMLGEGGTQVTSKTLLRDTGQGYRIDVENPAPGVRAGQLHLQAGGNKYIYNYGTGDWVPTPGSAAMSNRLAASVAGNPDVTTAIARGAGILNVP